MTWTPTDPLFSSQWHFGLLGDIQTIWNDYTGEGVTIAIYDDGVDYTTPTSRRITTPRATPSAPGGTALDPLPGEFRAGRISLQRPARHGGGGDHRGRGATSSAASAWPGTAPSAASTSSAARLWRCERPRGAVSGCRGPGPGLRHLAEQLGRHALLSAGDQSVGRRLYRRSGRGLRNPVGAGAAGGWARSSPRPRAMTIWMPTATG
jgi:hypothetical protein